ncbi:MAG: M28 family peptidase [Gammaproteobacteria bacterium]|nr:M28 family peptidase [Gammaproteobacteria bacterium]
MPDETHKGTLMIRTLNLLIALIAFVATATTRAEILIGFDEAGSKKQRALEAVFDKHLDAKELDAWLKQFSAKPHHAGSKAGKEVAEAIARMFTSWGFDTEIEQYYILLPTPDKRRLELIAPTKFKASLREVSLDDDPSTSVRKNLLPPYNAFSVDGDVEGELVFINYGRPEDHELLERYGIDLTGKIAIAKYGKTWRGIKPKLAAEKGAIATIIYSDPADDGYVKGDTYPTGPFKHESGVQRGSVMDMPTYPGDVLTPGVGATRVAKRLAIRDVTTITKVPVLPISYKDALPLLSAMGGAVVPAEWAGGLPITYHLGPGPAKVRLKVQFDWNQVTAYNVIARLKGSRYPDEWVIRGNHHDGWNHGAADPLSGLVALLAEAQSVAELAKSGSPPARTIIYAAWDAEEPGLIGSTEWSEHHAQALKTHTVAYLNTDGNSRGFVSIGGSHSLERFFNQIMVDVTDPQTGVPLNTRLRANITINGKEEEQKTIADKDYIRLYPLGSGSDYTPFLQHLGIASAHLSFSGEGRNGSYHTLYDTYEHYTSWRDPGLKYGIALAQVAGRATLRLANARVLPFDFVNLVANIATYIEELESLADKMREDTSTTNNLIEDGSYRIALDPTKSLGPPIRKQEVPFFNFAPLKNSLSRLRKMANLLDKTSKNNALPSNKLVEINRLLYTSERRLTRNEGLAGRPWYKHHIYAPGYYTGYGVKTIPGVRESIENRQFDKVAAQIDIAAEVLDSLTSQLEVIEETWSNAD